MIRLPDHPRYAYAVGFNSRRDDPEGLQQGGFPVHRLAVLLLLVVVLVAPLGPRSQVGAAPKDAIPAGAVPAKVVRAISGHTIVVERAGTRQTVYLRLVDAPRKGGPSAACFGSEATKRLAVMLPKGRTVYLERDDADPGGAGSLLRYVWFKGVKGGVYLANELMVREGYAILDEAQAIRADASAEGRGLDRLRAAQEEAKAKRAGWWTTCLDAGLDAALAAAAAAGAADVAALEVPATTVDTPTTDALAPDVAADAVDVAAPDVAAVGDVMDAAGPVVPVRVAIPAIGVDAWIEQVGVSDGVMGTPQDPWAVGWYPAYGAPGGGGSVVMAGHKDWSSIGPTVFADLSTVGGGETIFVTGADGSTVTYQVTAAWAVDASTPAEAVIGGAGGESLTLITCTGNFDGAAYDARYIVQAVRV